MSLYHYTFYQTAYCHCTKYTKNCTAQCPHTRAISSTQHIVNLAVHSAKQSRMSVCKNNQYHKIQWHSFSSLIITQQSVTVPVQTLAQRTVSLYQYTHLQSTRTPSTTQQSVTVLVQSVPNSTVSLYQYTQHHYKIHAVQHSTVSL